MFHDLKNAIWFDLIKINEADLHNKKNCTGDMNIKFPEYIHWREQKQAFIEYSKQFHTTKPSSLYLSIKVRLITELAARTERRRRARPAAAAP